MTARPTEPVTRDDFVKMMKCLDRRKRDDVRVGALLILLRMGLRRGEVMNLRFDDVLKLGGRPAICVRTLKQRGRRRHRVIPIADSEAAALLEKYLRQEHGTDSGVEDPLFFTLGRHGPCRRQPITARAIDYWVRRVAKQAGVDRRVTSHSFRHGCATDLLRSGADLRTVQQVLGHRSISSTSGYLHTTHELCADAISRLGFA